MSTDHIKAVVDPESQRKVLAGLEEFAKRAADASKANERVLQIGLTETRKAAPRRTGELIGTLAVDASAGGGVLSVGVSYAPYPEFGTRYVQARRFMRAGHEAMEQAAEPIYSEHLETAIRSAGG
jgi:HK97 gp10 family phage protein